MMNASSSLTPPDALTVADVLEDAPKMRLSQDAVKSAKQAHETSRWCFSAIYSIFRTGSRYYSHTLNHAASTELHIVCEFSASTRGYHSAPWWMYSACAKTILTVLGAKKKALGYSTFELQGVKG